MGVKARETRSRWMVEMEKDLSSSDSDQEESGGGSAPSPFFSVHVGDQLLEVTFVNTEDGLTDWLRSACRHRHSSTDVVGLTLFRGLPRGVRSKNKLKGKGSRFHPQHPSNSLSFLALCINRTDVLLFQLQSVRRDGRPDKIRALRDFLADKRAKIAAVGLKVDLQAMEKEWGVYVSNPVELSGSGRGQKLEEIAEAVLKVKIGPKPVRVADLDWARGKVQWDEEALMFAARDAFLCAEVGVRIV